MEIKQRTIFAGGEDMPSLHEERVCNQCTFGQESGQTHLIFEAACGAGLQDEPCRNSSLQGGLRGSFANLDVFALGQELVQLLDEEVIMEHQDQKPIETLVSQIPESLEKLQEKSCVTPPYRAPQVFLVGTAKRLVAGGSGDYYDATRYYYSH